MSLTKAVNDLAVNTRDPGPPAIVTATATLDISQRCVRVNPTDTTTITLPPVSEAAGLTFFICYIGTGTTSVTVQDNNNDAGLTSITLNANLERTCLVSDGGYWYEVAAHYS